MFALLNFLLYNNVKGGEKMFTKKIWILIVFIGLALSQLIYYSPDIIRQITPADGSTVSSYELNQIAVGMAHSDVGLTIGNYGKPINDNVYEFKSDRSLNNKNVRITFENDKVSKIVVEDNK